MCDAVEFCKQIEMDYFKEDIFQTFNVCYHLTKWEIFQKSVFCHLLHNKPDYKGFLDHKLLISLEKSERLGRF